MKKCKKCGAVQSGGRNLCIDCGALLGDAVSAEEEKRSDEKLSDTLTDMADQTESFHVSPRERLLGIISILAAAALLVAMPLFGIFVKTLRADLPEGVLVESGDGLLTIIGSGDEAAIAEAERILRETEHLEEATAAAPLAIALFISAALMFLCPKVSWRLGTLQARVYSHTPDVPSEAYLALEKIVKHASFILGCISVAVMLFRLL